MAIKKTAIKMFAGFAAGDKKNSCGHPGMRVIRARLD